MLFRDKLRGDAAMIGTSSDLAKRPIAARAKAPVTLAAALAFALSLSSCDLNSVLSGTASNTSTEDKVVLGLKTALQVGIDSSSAHASKVGGYFAHKVIKILL